MRSATGSSAGSVAERLDAEQGCPGVDLNVGGDEHVPNPSAHGRGDGELHLHRLDDGHPGPGLDHVVRRHVDAHDEGGGRSPDDAGVVAREAMGNTLHLDEVLAAVRRRDDDEAAIADGQAGAGRALPLDVDHGDDPVQIDVVPRRGDVPHGEPVRLASVA